MTQQLQYRPPQYIPAFERSRGLGTAVIVMAVVWTVGRSLTPPATGLLIANGTSTTFIAYNVLVTLWLVVGIAMFVLVGCWLGQARHNADWIAPDQQRLSKVWVWLSRIVPIVNLWFPSTSSTMCGEALSMALASREPDMGTFIAAATLTWFSPIVIASSG